MNDFLSVADMAPSELIEVLDTAAAVKKDSTASAGVLSGKSIGLFFQKPSARTRISTEVGAAELGMTPIVLKADEIGLGKREAVSDVGKVFDRYLDALAFRVFSHDDLVTLADNAEAPVINLLSDLEHPCQALADLQTVAETRPLPETVLTYVGDGNNVAHSLMLAGAMAGMEIRIVTPPGYEPADSVLAAANAYAGAVTVTNDVRQAVSDAHVVYTDVWASMGQEAEAEARKKLFMQYQVNGAVFDMAADGAIFLHCLPAHRGDEATDDVLDHARSRIFDQAENRLHSFKALLLHTFGR
ncbi:MAG: ornithine carbamoyltransferase [Acidimicrobiia bacterium]|nr:ornithine carbamoyltransferase [Acidimicrobiia bacterium]